jgi:ferrous iron transport protein B
MRFILAGQPNSGKSTIFNSVAGYRSATANFPGSSTTFTLSKALIHGREVEVIDLPGIYSLTSLGRLRATSSRRSTTSSSTSLMRAVWGVRSS